MNLESYDKVILVQIDSIMKYPPTISLINNLLNLKKKVYVLTTHGDSLKNIISADAEIIDVGDEYKYSDFILKKFISLFKIRKDIWKKIDNLYDADSIIWVMSNITVKHLGMRILKYRYNLHLFELMDSIYYFGKFPFFKMNLKKLCTNANRVIVCEYNRAYITQAWFRLEELPLIISNKPLFSKTCTDINKIHDRNAKELLQKLDNKKIILYQGIVDKERPIEYIAEAVENLNEKFVFVVMTGSNCDNLVKYKKTYILPFINPPYHLEVTCHAYIGILIYKPVYGGFTSPLNAIYCAPNKIYEYSKFGLPMIGNDIPGLKYTIENNKMGKCFDILNIKQISEMIEQIDNDYSAMSKKSLEFFEKTSNDSEIIKALIKKKK